MGKSLKDLANRQQADKASALAEALRKYREIVSRADSLTDDDEAVLAELLPVLGIGTADAVADAAAFKRAVELDPVAASVPDRRIGEVNARRAVTELAARERMAMNEFDRLRREAIDASGRAGTALHRASVAAGELARIHRENPRLFGT